MFSSDQSDASKVKAQSQLLKRKDMIAVAKLANIELTLIEHLLPPAVNVSFDDEKKD